MSRPPRSALALATAVAAACTGRGPESPRWTSLAGAFEPAAVRLAPARTHADARGRELAWSTGPTGARLAVDVARADWIAGEPGPDGGTTWRIAPAPCAPADRAELTAPGLGFAFASRGDPSESEFAFAGDALVLALAAGEEPPERATLAVTAERGERVAGAWRASGRRTSGEAVALFPGEAWERVLDVPPGAALRFAATVEPLVLEPGDRGDPGERIVFRVELDGVLVLEEELSPARSASVWRTVELPAGGARRLRLAVEGPPARTGFFAPVVGPAVAPADGRRPDLVLFLADTFRADNLAAYGGTHEVTPFLDRLARESLWFPRAWSPSTFTLPAHASLFTGVFPRQVGIVGTGRALPAAFHTLAERLAEAGYRTGAVTDSVIVSHRYGMDQGFAWFDELPPLEGGLDETVRRAVGFLEAADGRPSFLFVQTYRTHLPYRVDPDTLAAHAERLGIEGRAERLHEELAALERELATRARTPADEQRLGRLVRSLHGHYLGGVIDLDRGVERFAGELGRLGLWDRGYLLFTSDHGEAFYEHGFAYHTDKVYDELCRVPLLLHGPGLEPAPSPAQVSLLDVAPTLAELAGIAADPTWLGRSLLGPADDRPTFLFECQEPERSTVAVVEGMRKAIGTEAPGALERGDVLAAFELEADPAERASVAGSAWPRELLRRRAEELRLLLEPLVAPEAADLDAGELDELRALGYGGD